MHAIIHLTHEAAQHFQKLDFIIRSLKTIHPILTAKQKKKEEERIHIEKLFFFRFVCCCDLNSILLLVCSYRTFAFILVDTFFAVFFSSSRFVHAKRAHTSCLHIELKITLIASEKKVV